MVNSLPASDVLKDSEKLFALAENSPIILSENGNDRLVVLSIDDYYTLAGNYSGISDLPESMQDTPETIKEKLIKSCKSYLNPNTELITLDECIEKVRNSVAKQTI